MSVLQAEWLKLRTTRTIPTMLGALGVVVAAAGVVHIIGFDRQLIDDTTDQRRVLLDIGVNLAVAFSAIVGALSITTEFRHGTIRATLLKQPDRSRIVSAKALTQLATSVFGVVGVGVATATCAALLALRDVGFALDAAQVVRLIGGGALAATAFGAVGLGVGSVVRNQVPTVVGLLVWLLFFENLLRAGAPSVGKFAPGSLARAVAGGGEASVDSPWVAAALLVALAAAVLAGGRIVLVRRDVN